MGKHWAIWRDLKDIGMDMKTFCGIRETKRQSENTGCPKTIRLQGDE